MPQFGIAVERARLTHLWGEPVALESAEGTLAAISDEAAAAGIRAGQAVNGARATCERLIVLPYDREAYKEAAQPVWDLFAIESSVVEPVSPELCYVELTGPGVVERAQQLADELTARIRITVRAGVGRTKLVARRAATEGRREEPGVRREDRAPGFKPIYSDPDMVMEVMRRPPESPTAPARIALPPGSDGVQAFERSGGSPSQPIPPPAFNWIRPGTEAQFLASLPLEKAPGIDFKLVKRLQRLGVKTLGDISKIPPRELRRQLKDVALLLQRLAEGEDGDRVRPLWPPRRIEKTIAFDDEVCDRATVEEALRRCAESIAGSLRQKHEYCRTVTLTVQIADGSCLQETEKPAVPLDAEKTIHRTTLRLLGRMPIEQPLTGVALRASDLGTGSGIQLALLDENDHAKGLPHERARSLEAALGNLRKRYGVGAVLTLSMLRQARRIGLWTYPLGHLLDEPVDVATDHRGAPVRYWRRGRRRQVNEVKRIQNRWKEAEWFWGTLSERTVYRVETEPAGLSELHSIGVRWRLCSAAD